jgi:hypothetical protein
MPLDLERFGKQDLLLASQFIVIVFLSALLFTGGGDKHKTYLEDELESKVPVKGFNGSLDVSVNEDMVSGYNILINATGFEFTPENVNSYHALAKGHAHVYINGVKVDRAYSKYYYLYDVPNQQKFNLTITLQSNDHRTYYKNGKPVMYTQVIQKS